MTDDGPGRGPNLVVWRAVVWTRRSIGRFVAARGPRQSAAIAYYVLLSLFPLILVVASVAGVVLKDEGLRADVVGAFTDALPITEAGAGDLDSALRGVGSNAAGVGLISLAGLIWSAGGMMGAIRGSLDDLESESRPRPFVWSKLVDLSMLLAAAVLLFASAGLTVATRVARRETADAVGLPVFLYEVGRVAVPILVGATLLVLLLRWVPSRGPAVRDIWPAALGGGCALWGLAVGFAAFIDNFGSYNVVYGSLAAAIVFLVFVYAAAYLVLLTAAFAAEWHGVRHERPGSEPGPGLGAEVRGFLRSLIRNQPPSPPTR